MSAKEFTSQKDSVRITRLRSQAVQWFGVCKFNGPDVSYHGTAAILRKLPECRTLKTHPVGFKTLRIGRPGFTTSARRTYQRVCRFSPHKDYCQVGLGVLLSR